MNTFVLSSHCFLLSKFLRVIGLSYSLLAVVIGVRPMGLRGAAAPLGFFNSHFRAKNQVIFGQNHLIFVQVMETNIRARDFSPPELNSSGTLMAVVFKFRKSNSLSTLQINAIVASFPASLAISSLLDKSLLHQQQMNLVPVQQAWHSSYVFLNVAHVLQFVC